MRKDLFVPSNGENDLDEWFCGMESVGEAYKASTFGIGQVECVSVSVWGDEGVVNVSKMSGIHH